MKVLAVGGGSGGHVTPIAAVVEELSSSVDHLDVHFVCDTAFEAQARQVMSGMSQHVEISTISAGKLRRYAHFRTIDYITSPKIVFSNLRDIARTLIGILQSVKLLRRYKPDIVFAKGGYVCLPVGVAARICRVPLMIHDSDARPGLTNRILASSAARIATGYPVHNYNYPAHKTVYTGVPVRAGYVEITPTMQKRAKAALSLSEDEVMVVSIGGGLGSRSINSAMIDATPALLSEGVRLEIIAGKLDYKRVSSALSHYEPQARVREFVTDELLMILSAADIVVTRASATTIQELAALKKPIIAVPSRALGDQKRNAEVLAESQAALVLTDDQLQDSKLQPTLLKLIKDEDMRVKIADSLHELSNEEAARDVAQIIVKVYENLKVQSSV